jgi:hypothetical protein
MAVILPGICRWGYADPATAEDTDGAPSAGLRALLARAQGARRTLPELAGTQLPGQLPGGMPVVVETIEGAKLPIGRVPA